MRSTRASVFLFALAAVTVGTACDRGPRPAPDAIATTVSRTEPVTREILAQMDDPPGAPGRRLTLVRYTIAPDAELAPHIHPGVQLASILSGTLTYQVVSGTATVHRGVSRDGLPAETEELVGPAETALGPGDVVIEHGDMVHFGANRTPDPVVILATLITDPAQELAVPVSTAPLQ